MDMGGCRVQGHFKFTCPCGQDMVLVDLMPEFYFACDCGRSFRGSLEGRVEILPPAGELGREGE